MAALSYTSGPAGDFRATIGGAGGYGLGGGGRSWLEQLARRSAQNKLRKQQLEMELLKKQVQDAKKIGGMKPEDPFEKRMKELQLRKLSAETEAVAGRAPLKMTYIGAGPGFLTPDENLMTGAMRRAFLPGGADLAGPSLAEVDAVRGMEGRDWWSRSSPEGRQDIAQERLSRIRNPNVRVPRSKQKQGAPARVPAPAGRQPSPPPWQPEEEEDYGWGG